MKCHTQHNCKPNVHNLARSPPHLTPHQEPLFREFAHWVVANIPPASAPDGSASVQHGDVVAPYVGAGPPHASGLHRCVGLMHKRAFLFSRSRAFVSCPYNNAPAHRSDTCFCFTVSPSPCPLKPSPPQPHISAKGNGHCIYFAPISHLWCAAIRGGLKCAVWAHNAGLGLPVAAAYYQVRPRDVLL